MGLDGVLEAVTVAPGESASADLVVHNSGDEPVDVEMAVTGYPASWSWVAPPTASVPARGEARSKVFFRCPPGSDAAAGDHPYQVRLRTIRDRRELAQIAGVVTVATLADVVAALVEMTPASPEQPDFLVDVRNRGNGAVSVSLSVRPVEGLSIRLDPEALVVPAGAAERSRVHVETVGTTRADVEREIAVDIAPEGSPALTVTGLFHQMAPLRRRWPKVVVAVVALAVAVAFIGPRIVSGGSDDATTDATATAGADATADPLAFDPQCPGRGHLAAEANGFERGGPVPVAYSFLFVAEDGCTPVRFDPCQPIPYVTNEALARPGDLADLSRALDMVSEATGIEFVHEGATDERPGLRGAHDPRYGDRWAPVLVAWVDAETMARVVEGSLGDSDFDPTEYPGAGVPVLMGESYVSGTLILNAGAIDPRTGQPLPNGFGPGLNWGRVMVHELGHLVGLGHIRSVENLMQHQLGLHTTPSDQWGPGDLVGLRALGTEAGCAPAPEFDPAAPGVSNRSPGPPPVPVG